jgi:Ca2+-binding EF-hand superfamily protein
MTKSNSPYGQMPPQLPPKGNPYGAPMMGQPQPMYGQPPSNPYISQPQAYQTQPPQQPPYQQSQNPQFRSNQPPQQYQTQPPSNPFISNQPQQYQTQQPQYKQQQTQPTYQLQPVNNNAWYGGYAQQIQPQELDQLRQWFTRVDTDRSGSIDATELQQVTFGGQPIGYEVAHKLIQVFDENRNGTIDFNEYAAMHKFIGNMRQAFMNADSDKSGRIEANEIYNALGGAGFNYLTQNSVKELTTKYDKTRYGLDWPQFLLMAASIAHVRSVYQWNDKQNKGYITLTIDQLTQIAAYLY